MQRFSYLAICLIIIAFSTFDSFSQGSEKYNSGLKININEDGSRYFRLITWHQFWTTVAKNQEGNLDASFMLRRSRLLMYAQISKRFLIVTHLGLNGVTAENLHPTGKSDGVQLFMHDAYLQYAILPGKLEVGAGLHYWNGVSRLTNTSTLNMLTLDAPRFNWPGIGTTGQFARNLGVFLHGKVNRFGYRAGVNEAMINPIDKLAGMEPMRDTAVYLNSNERFVYDGYFHYELLDKESDLLPYAVGSYLGTRSVLNIGAGFSFHPSATTSLGLENNKINHDAFISGIDIFLDVPLGKNLSAVTAYFVWYHFSYGPNYSLGEAPNDLIATGDIFYGHAGYLIPKFSNKIRLQPYISSSFRNPRVYEGLGTTIAGGLNVLIDGQNAKISLEYNSNDPAWGNRTNLFRIQAMVYL